MDKPIRVLQVFTIMNRGGAESMIMNYYRNIDRTKIQFDFLVHRTERGAFDDEIESLGGKIFRLPKINILKLNQYRKQLNIFFTRNKEYTIVHAHLNALSLYFLKIAKAHKIPIRIAHSHIALSKPTLKFLFQKDIDFKSKLKIILKTFLKRSITKYSSHYFACGIEAGEWLFGKNNITNVVLINNAIDSKKFEYSSVISNENKTKLNINGKFVIGHVGRFDMQKNHSFLIDIFKEIHNLNSKSVLLLIGEGNLLETIKKKVKTLNIEQSVKFLGVQSDIPFYLQTIDVFLFPSLYEGLPVTLIESQAAGLKTLVSDKVDVASKITDLVEFISLEESPRYWAEKVLEYASGYTRKDTSQIIIEKGYDVKKNALNLQELYFNYLNEYL